MLTALDIPDELLYSADAVWLRYSGLGSARLGLLSYAALGERSDVYLVKLPKAGARLERGRPFGHVDLGRSTVPLRSPVSGTVLFANQALKGEPELLVRDPYGRGYLLEVEGVAEAEIDALLDRDDAVRHFSRFVPEGPIAATQVYEPGRPWANTLALRFGGSTHVQARMLPPAGNEVFTPDWVTGDGWTVETRTERGVRRFAYEVLGPGRVAGEEVVRVRAREVALPGAGKPPEPAFHRVLHYRTADWTLAAQDEVPTADPLAARRRFNPRGREAWLETAEAQDGFIADHPRLPLSLDDEARDIPKGEKLDARGQPVHPAVAHYVKFRGGLTRLEAELRADIAREDGRGTERLLSEMALDRGAPWWKEMKRKLGEKELGRAVLVRD